MNSRYRKILKKFQSDRNRQIEESFAQMLTERTDVRLFFINENSCYTDGQNIVIDPGERKLFADREALIQAEDMLGLDHEISDDPVLALKMCARASNVHESLHIIYTNFPPDAVNDKRAPDNIRRAALSAISNIIEDAFIEAAGCSEFDNIEHLLLWNRVALSLVTYGGPSTIDKKFEEVIKNIEPREKSGQHSTDKNENKEEANAYLDSLLNYLDYMADFLLYPFYKQPPPPEEISVYVENTKQSFLDGSVCGNADERYTFTQKIFDLIEPLIPRIDDPQKLHSEMIEKWAQKVLGGNKTHNGNAPSLANYSGKGKTALITRKLFTDKEGRLPANFTLLEKIKQQNVQFKNESEDTGEEGLAGSTEIHSSGEYDCAAIHRGINIKVKKPKVNLNLKRAYQNLLNKYRLIVNSYTNRFSQLLKGTADETEEKKYFGRGISAKHFTDPKKRFWYRTVRGEAAPDAGFLILIDGSGSMEGERIAGASAAALILHEVLRANNVEHAIVEHRAMYGEPLLVHNVLVSFGGRKEEKYNLLGLEADEGTREGLSLYWAEKYLGRECRAEHKIIIMISDGAPAHSYEDDSGNERVYDPPLSVKDTALAVKKITRRGTGIIAIALDKEGDYACYEQLKAIYSDVVSCTDIGKLTGQLLGVVTKALRRM